jgi:hypothetical protein
MMARTATRTFWRKTFGSWKGVSMGGPVEATSTYPFPGGLKRMAKEHGTGIKEKYAIVTEKVTTLKEGGVEAFKEMTPEQQEATLLEVTRLVQLEHLQEGSYDESRQD